MSLAGKCHDRQMRPSAIAAFGPTKVLAQNLQGCLDPNRLFRFRALSCRRLVGFFRWGAHFRLFPTGKCHRPANVWTGKSSTGKCRDRQMS